MTGVATTARPGDYFVVATASREAAVIRWAERHAANQLDRPGAWANHAGIIGPNGTIWEAQPRGGFQQAHLEKYAGCRLEVSTRALTTEQRLEALAVCRSLESIPYGWDDILALGISTLGSVSDPVWKQLDRPDRLICSQAVAHVYRSIGDPVTLGNDCRVTPAHLALPRVLTGGQQ